MDETYGCALISLNEYSTTGFTICCMIWLAAMRDLLVLHCKMFYKKKTNYGASGGVLRTRCFALYGPWRQQLAYRWWWPAGGAAWNSTTDGANE